MSGHKYNLHGLESLMIYDAYCLVCSAPSLSSLSRSNISNISSVANILCPGNMSSASFLEKHKQILIRFLSLFLYVQPSKGTFLSIDHYFCVTFSTLVLPGDDAPGELESELRVRSCGRLPQQPQRKYYKSKCLSWMNPYLSGIPQQ